MAKPFTLDFVLEPAVRDRLANLCGPEDENLKYIEKYLKVTIAYSGEHFQVVGAEKMARTAQKIIYQLYLETAPVGRQKKAPYLTLEKVHLTLLESRVLMQDAAAESMLEKYQDSTAAATAASGQLRGRGSFPPVWGSTDRNSSNGSNGSNDSTDITGGNYNNGRNYINYRSDSADFQERHSPSRSNGSSADSRAQSMTAARPPESSTGSHGAVTAADELFAQMDSALHLEDSPYFADAQRYSYADEEAARIAAQAVASAADRAAGAAGGAADYAASAKPADETAAADYTNYVTPAARAEHAVLNSSNNSSSAAGKARTEKAGAETGLTGNHGNHGRSDYYASIFKDSSFVPRSTAELELQPKTTGHAEPLDNLDGLDDLDKLEGLDNFDELDELERLETSSALKRARTIQVVESSSAAQRTEAAGNNPQTNLPDELSAMSVEYAHSTESVKSMQSAMSAENADNAGSRQQAAQNRQQFKEQRKMTDWREMRDLTAVNAGDFKAQGNLELDSAMDGRSRGGAGTFGEAQGQGASHGQASQGGEINRMYNKASTLKLKHGVVRPRTANQSTYIASIGTHDVNFGIGPAGTGKTYLAVAAAVDALERNEVRRIILTRPAVEAGEKLGFLPGDLSQKVDPYLRPLYDALFEMLGFEKVEKLIERQIIEIAPLAYMRGRTLNDSFIILDEAQNTTIEQMKMFLTRIGFNSKAVITGDPSQIDLPRNVKSGLKHALEVLQGIDSISFTFFETVDVVRHPVVAAIVNAYAAWDKKQEELKAQRLREGIESRMSGEGLPHAFREGRGGYSRGSEQRFSQRAGGSAEFIPAEAVTDRAAEAGQAQPAEPAAKAAQDAAAAAAAVKPEE